MKKVLCVSEGKQIDTIKVKKGVFYNVIGTVTNGEIGGYDYPDKIFYFLAETGVDVVFWEGLFLDVIDNENDDAVEEATQYWIKETTCTIRSSYKTKRSQ